MSRGSLTAEARDRWSTNREPSESQTQTEWFRFRQGTRDETVPRSSWAISAPLGARIYCGHCACAAPVWFQGILAIVQASGQMSVIPAKIIPAPQ